MPFPPLLAIAQQLSTADIKRLPALKRSLPKIGRLEARRKRIISQLAAVDSQLAILAGEDEPAIKKRGGRKPAAKGKPGRKPA
ncbi:MAG: hypothetical protein FWG74_07885, partial [Planctomycetes bacterium]|nr:hypothetical protein [Planctomycetota bacterium]